MNKEEIEELEEFTIDLTDIDEIALGLEICSKKSNMVIQEFADTIIQLQQKNKQLEENYDRIYNENCILREKHNINDIGLLDENYKLQKVIDKAIDYIGSNDIEVLKYHDTPSETTSYEIVTIDLLKILKGDGDI